jgi:hypothetical protein
MGGFLSGIGSALSGAGDAAAEYGKQQRQLIQQMKLAAVEQIHNQLKETPLDSAKYAEGIGHINKILGSGDDQGSLIGIGKRVAGRWLHHDVVNAAQDIANRSGPLVVPGGPPPPLTPGPALPGNPAGAPQAPPSGQSTNLAPAAPVPAGEVSSNLIIPPDSTNSPIGDASGYTQPSSDMNLMGQGSLSRSAQNPGPIAAQPASSPIQGGSKIQEPPPPSSASAMLKASTKMMGGFPPFQASDRAAGEAPSTIPLLPAPGVQSASPIAMMPPALPLGAPAQREPTLLERHDRYLAGLADSSSPAAQALVRDSVQPEITQRAELNKARALDEYETGRRVAGLKALEASPEWASMPDILKGEYRLWAHSKGPLPTAQASLFYPKNTPGTVLSSSIDDEDFVDEKGRRMSKTESPYAREHRQFGHIWYTAAPPPIQTAFNAQGGLENVNKVAGKMPEGFTLPSQMKTEKTATSVTSPEGVKTDKTTTQRLPAVSPQGAPAVSGQTPVPSSPGAPSVSPKGLTMRSSVKPLDPTNDLDHRVIAIAKDAQSGKILSSLNPQDKAQISHRMTELGLEPGMVTSSMRERAKNARLILDHLQDINKIIDEADKAGELGVVATRWNDFLTNRLGDDPTKNHVFSRLSSELGFLSTAVSMAHGGLKGGSSPTMVEHWEKALDAKDPGTLRAKLGEATKWMRGYAQLDNGMAKPEFIAPPSTAASALGAGSAKSPSIKTREEYDALPIGSGYVDAETGKRHVKGR